MAQLIVRNIEDEIKASLRRKAARHGRSMEEEVRAILRNAVGDDAAPALPIGTRLKRRFASVGLDEDIAELGRQPAHPAEFDE